MKFIKADGAVEEGTPLTEATAILRDKLEQYFHVVICEHAYHSCYNVARCALAANFLALALNDSDLTRAVEAELRIVDPPPAPVVEPVPAP